MLQLVVEIHNHSRNELLARRDSSWSNDKLKHVGHQDNRAKRVAKSALEILV